MLERLPINIRFPDSIEPHDLHPASLIVQSGGFHWDAELIIARIPSTCLFSDNSVTTAMLRIELHGPQGTIDASAIPTQFHPGGIVTGLHLALNLPDMTLANFLATFQSSTGAFL